MNVQELLDTLQAIPDKSIPIVISKPVTDGEGYKIDSEILEADGAELINVNLASSKTMALFISEH